MYYLLALINLAIFAIYFQKDPVVATAICLGVIIALTISGVITFVEKLIIKRKENNHDEI